MSHLIEKADIDNYFEKTFCKECRRKNAGLGVIGCKCTCTVSEIREALLSTKEVEAEPVKRGKWLLGGKYSECNGDAPFYPMASTYYESKYCPHCDVKMNGGKK